MAALTRAAWAERLLTGAEVTRPFGLGPLPTVLHFHGCGGLRPFERRYAARARQAGYAVVTVDSFKPRGISRLSGSLTVCTGLQLHGSERAADVYAMYDWVRNQNWADPQRIVLAGWSHGAWTVMDALAMGEAARRFTHLADLPPRPLMGLAGAILVYPYAGFPSMTRQRGWQGEKPRVFGLLAGKDHVVGTRYPAAALDRLERDGLRVDRLVFPDATHAFDDEGASDPRAVYRPDLVDRALAWYGGALRSLKG